MSEETEAQIDEIIAMCDGNLRGAVKALMLVNEHLENQLEKFRRSRGVPNEYQMGSPRGGADHTSFAP
jgi:hypothetical protein